MTRVPAGVWAIANGLDSLAAADEFADRARAAAAWTFRRPAGSDRAVVGWLKRLAEQAPWLAVHARGDWMRAAGANAVIAGAHSLPVAELRTLHPDAALGASVHDTEEIAAATEGGADFLVFGPVWDTPSKRRVLKPRGLDALGQAVETGLPVYAIGGADQPERVSAACAAGAAGVLVLRAARDRGQLVELVAAWNERYLGAPSGTE